MKINSTKIWDDGRHNAFTDLVAWKGQYYCGFRSGLVHLGGLDEESAGQLIVIRSADLEDWQEVLRLAVPAENLYSTQLLALPSEIRLHGYAWHKTASIVYPDETKKMALFRGKHVVCLAMASEDGTDWGQPKYFCPHYALWRPRFDGQSFYSTASLAMGPEPTHMDMLTSKDGYEWRMHSHVAASDRVGEALWSPGEGEMLLLPDNTCLLFVRRSYNGPNWPELTPEEAEWWPATLKVLRGKNFPDIEKWETINEGNYIMACASLYHQGSIYVAGRDIVSTGPELSDYQFATALYRFDIKTGFEKLAQFPEAQATRGEPMNDCGYPGLIALGRRELAMSYYSSHEGSTNIYLARVQL